MPLPESAPTTATALTVGDLDERELLARILTRLPATRELVGPGDDAAVLAADGQIVVTADTMIEGPDFRSYFSTPRQLGLKAVVSNLADILAMGATPVGLVVSLALPRETPAQWVDEFTDGLVAGLDRHAPGASILGGDLARAPQIVIAVTALGRLDGPPVLRSGARPGDIVAVSGPLGRAAAGLRLLFDGHGEDARFADLVRAQLEPAPDLAAGRRAAAAGVHAMMDLSDGLLLDADRLAHASGVRIDLDPARFDTGTLAALLAPVYGEDAGELALRLQLGGGEEHTMLAAFDPDTPLPEGFTRIGRVHTSECPADPVAEDGDPGVDGCPSGTVPGPGITVAGQRVTPAGWNPFAADTTAD